MRPFVLIALLTVPALSQTPTFEIADIHNSPHSSQPFMTGGLGRGGRYQLRQATMVDLIKTAYGINADNVLGGPAWLESDRFDVFAQAPPNTSDAIPGMLQALLADRFGLVLHKDTKPLPAFVLSVGKGKPNLKEAVEGAGAPDARRNSRRARRRRAQFRCSP